VADPRRVEKVNVLIREVVAGILAREAQFPEGTLVTVTRVSASHDLYYATVFVSILGGGAEAEALAFAELRKETGAVQHLLNRALRMRPVPKITFAIDVEEKRRERVEKLLGKQAREG